MARKATEITIPLPPVERSARGLRDAIFDEIDALRAGTVQADHARALANLIRQCIDAARLDLQSRRPLPDSLPLSGALPALSPTPDANSSGKDAK